MKNERGHASDATKKHHEIVHMVNTTNCEATKEAIPGSGIYQGPLS